MTKDNIYNLMKAHAEKENGRYTFKVIDLKCACAELMDMIEQFHKPNIMRGGDIKDNPSHMEGSMLINPIITNSLNTPTEPLPAEALALTVCADLADHDYEPIGNQMWRCQKCGKEIRG